MCQNLFFHQCAQFDLIEKIHVAVENGDVDFNGVQRGILE